MGDFNAHTSDRNAGSYTRTSPDSKLDGYGRSLIDICTHTSSCVVNGTLSNYSGHTYVPDSNCVATDSVLDYCVCSFSLFPFVSLNAGHTLFSSDLLPLIAFVSLPLVTKKSRKRKRGYFAANPFIHTTIPLLPNLVNRPPLPPAAPFPLLAEPKGLSADIQPITAFSDTASASAIRQKITFLAKSPGCSTNAASKDEH